MSLPACLTDEHRARLRSLFEWLVDPCLAFVRRNCRELVPTSDIALPVSLMSTLHALMDEMRDEKSEVGGWQGFWIQYMIWCCFLVPWIEAAASKCACAGLHC